MSEAAELVRKYSQEQCKFEDLVDFVKCQECFSTLISQITEQLGSDSDAAARMATNFPRCLRPTAEKPAYTTTKAAKRKLALKMGARAKSGPTLRLPVILAS